MCRQMDQTELLQRRRGGQSEERDNSVSAFNESKDHEEYLMYVSGTERDKEG